MAEFTHRFIADEFQPDTLTWPARVSVENKPNQFPAVRLSMELGSFAVVGANQGPRGAVDVRPTAFDYLYYRCERKPYGYATASLISLSNFTESTAHAVNFLDQYVSDGFVIQKKDLVKVSNVQDPYDYAESNPDAYDPVFAIYTSSNENNFAVLPLNPEIPIEITTGKLIVPKQ